MSHEPLPTTPLTPAQAAEVATAFGKIRAQVSAVIRGKDSVIDQVLAALLAGGHVLLEDLPGMGKTTLAYALARAIDCGFQRIQFTSDLLPGDILGVSVFQADQARFVFHPGPIFSHILLADEINRSTPKTQSALLEAMDRGKVTVDGETRPLGSPFLVLATQNPVDFEGTFPLPDSQMDRFLLRLQMGYPAADHELAILARGWLPYDRIEMTPVVHGDDIQRWQAWVERVFVEEAVLRQMLEFVHATRTMPGLRHGLSTRGALALKRAAQAFALLAGREFVLPQDWRAVAPAVCVHRLALALPPGDVLAERSAVLDLLQPHLR
jgi:MoxR-like ATPase